MEVHGVGQPGSINARYVGLGGLEQTTRCVDAGVLRHQLIPRWQAAGELGQSGREPPHPAADAVDQQFEYFRPPRYGVPRVISLRVNSDPPHISMYHRATSPPME